VPADAWHRLPEDEDGLLDAARAYYGCEHLLAVPGTQAAIQALPYLRPRCRVGVLSPGYAEHAHAWRMAGHTVVTLPMAELLARAATFDVMVFISPNNPTAETLPADMSWLSGRHGGWVVVDEAFGDTRPDTFMQPRDGLVLLRSIGKFFGMAGARAGFVAAWPALLDALRERLGPWALSGPTRFAVTQALRNTAWQGQMRERLRAESAQLAALLQRAGISPAGGTDLFQYCVHADSALLHRSLARRGILTRLFDDPAALRFGLPPDEAGFARLAEALSESWP
jgi:cobalamin biosynthesis protein CobC